VEGGNNSSLKFSSLISSNGNWWERFPEDGLANIGSNKQGDTWSKAITFLEEFIEHQDHESSDE
jgi:hypothetical protein